MRDDDHPVHSIFIRWGRFEVGAFGRPAIVAVCFIASAVIFGRLLGMWWESAPEPGQTVQ